MFVKKMDMSPEELRRMIDHNDERALSFLYGRYAKSLLAVIANLVKNREEAEDVLQETFVKIWENFGSYDAGKGRLYTWMLNIARNSAIDKLRSKGYNDSKKNLPEGSFINLLQDERLMRRVDTIGIKEFVKKLRPKCIQLIELLFFKGYTQQEAAETLDIPLGTVKTQNRGCINDLRNFLTA